VVASFFGLVPLLGWVFLAVVVSRSSPWSGGGGGGGGRSVDMAVSKVLVSFVATFLTLALLVVSFTAAGASADTTPPEPAPACGSPSIVEESESPSPQKACLSQKRHRQSRQSLKLSTLHHQ